MLTSLQEVSRFEVHFVLKAMLSLSSHFRLVQRHLVSNNELPSLTSLGSWSSIRFTGSLKPYDAESDTGSILKYSCTSILHCLTVSDTVLSSMVVKEGAAPWRSRVNPHSFKL